MSLGGTASSTSSPITSVAPLRVARAASDIIVLSRADLAALMRFGDYVEAVAEAFRQHAQGDAVLPDPMHIPGDGGGFHVKAASLGGYVAVKTNSNFPQNPRRGLPTIQGAVLLFDAGGVPLALIDSIEITIKRTGAATAVAARYLARPESRTATICGCGAQARVQLDALRHGLDIRRVFAFDSDPQAAERFAAEVTAQGLEAEIAASLRAATRESDIVVTCTTAQQPYLDVADVRSGTFIAAIGADNPEKSEIAPALMAKARVVTDVTALCAVMGDLHHAVKAGAMRQADVYAELGALVAGRPGRNSPEQITLFGGCCVGIQDVAAAGRAYELACERGSGTRIGL